MGASQSSRKYVDLILDASSKWANWDPPHQIKVGDYGIVNKKTALFEKEGNVYDEKDDFKLTANHRPKSTVPEDVFETASSSVKRFDLNVAPEINVAGLSEASVKGQWQFDDNRGALLLMAHPRISFMPSDASKVLIDNPALTGKSLVTEVISCPAYSMYLSSGNKDVVSLALVGKLPIPNAPGVTGGGEVSASWWTQNASGLFRSACDKKGTHSYTPLYVLKTFPKKRTLRRGSPTPEPDPNEPTWVDTQRPWDPLNEDGEEDVIEDTIFD